MRTNTTGWYAPPTGIDHVVIDNRGDDRDDYQRRVQSAALNGRMDELTAAGARTAAELDSLEARQRRTQLFGQALAAGMSPEQARSLLGVPDRPDPKPAEPTIVEQANGRPLVIYPGERVSVDMLRGATGIRRR